MDFFTWSDDFLTGIEIVDRQHRRLVELINAAAPVLQDFTPERQDERLALFAGLLDYTGVHFHRSEERRGGEECVNACRFGWWPYD